MYLCKKCSFEFTPVKGLINFCSLKCKNSRNRKKGIYKHSEKTKQKIKEGNIKRYIDNPDLKKQIGKKIKLKIENGETVRKHTEQTKQKMSDIRKKILEEKPWLHPNVLCANIVESYPEKIFREFLEENNFKINIDFLKQYKIGNYYVDFFIPKFNLGIEIDGERWHNLNSEKETQRQKYIEEHIFLKRFWAKEILKKQFKVYFETLI